MKSRIFNRIIVVILTQLIVVNISTIFAQKATSSTKNVSVNGSTTLNGEVGIASSGPMKFVNNGYIPRIEIFLVPSNVSEYTDGIRGVADNSGKCIFKDVIKGKYKLYCLLPGTIEQWAKQAQLINSAIHVNFIIDEGIKYPISIGSKTSKNPLLFYSPDISFSGTVPTFMVTVQTSTVNYGTVDIGIK